MNCVQLTSRLDTNSGLIGGKAAGLVWLLQRGHQTPDAFCILTTAYADTLQRNGLAELASIALRHHRPHDVAAMRRAMLEASIDSEVEAEISVAVEALTKRAGPTRDLIVRSSASVEDSAHASFAGLFESVIGVPPASVMDAIRTCWASLWTPHALAYRATQLDAHGAWEMAVIVQTLVDADCSGIMLTRHPTLISDDFIAINAVFGLASDLADGTAPADTFVFDKIAGIAVQQELVQKTSQVRLDGHAGTRRVAIGAERRLAPAIDELQLARLTKCALDIERAVGQPMYIEWAFRAEKLFLVQARPAVQATIGRDDTEAAPEWTQAEELFPSPCIPWTSDLFRLFLDVFNSRQWIWGGDRPLEARVFGRYIYLNKADPSETGQDFRGGKELLLRSVPALWRAQWRAMIERECHDWLASDVAAADLQDNWRLLQQMLAARRRHELLGLYAGMVADFAFEAFMPLIPEPDAARREQVVARIAQGLPSLADDLEAALYALLSELRRSPDVLDDLLRRQPGAATRRLLSGPRRWQPLAMFLRQWGFCGIDHITSQPWSERPERLIRLLQQRLRGDLENPADRLGRLAGLRSEAVQELRSRVRPEDRAEFDRRLADLEACAPMNQDRYIVVVEMGYAAIRHVLGELGRKLARSGQLASPADVYLLSLQELDGLVNSGERADPERLARVRAELSVARRRIPPKIVDAQGRPRKSAAAPAPAPAPVAAVIYGAAASPGRAAGAAVIAPRLVDIGRVARGDVLITQTTTPAWTPIFPMLRAIVTETGSVLSHPAILAREYGIPAVVGARGAMAAVSPGEFVTVDGAAGWIERTGAIARAAGMALADR